MVNEATIKQLVGEIQHDKYLLPFIQRKFVWNENQIVSLFDTVFLGYPIPSFLVWDCNMGILEKKYKDKYKLYRFLNYINYESNLENEEYIPSDNLENRLKNVVLDGQQRLTSFYVGALGKIRIKNRGPGNYKYKEKKLYINLLNNNEYNEEEEQKEEESKDNYEYTDSGYFKFLSENELENKNKKENELWFEISNIIRSGTEYENENDYKKVPKYNEYDREKQDIIRDNFQKLFIRFTKNKVILIQNLDEDNSLNRAMNIFIRTNSGGTKLSKMDLLMSIISSYWKDAREKIDEEKKNIQDRYNFKFENYSALYLTGQLLLTDIPITIKVENFNKKNVDDIKSEFYENNLYIELAFKFMKEIGISEKPNISIFMIAYYFKHNNIREYKYLTDSNIKLIKLFIFEFIFLQWSGGRQTTIVLEKFRKNIKENTGEFPLEKIGNMMKDFGYSTIINKEELEKFVKNSFKGSKESKIILTLISPQKDYDNKSFDEDHIYPQSKLSEKYGNEVYKNTNGGNFVANLQLLLDYRNREEKRATMPEEWLNKRFNGNKEEIKRYKEENLIPTDIELTMDNFEFFIEKRIKLIVEELMKIIE